MRARSAEDKQEVQEVEDKKDIEAAVLPVGSTEDLEVKPYQSTTGPLPVKQDAVKVLSGFVFLFPSTIKKLQVVTIRPTLRFIYRP